MNHSNHTHNSFIGLSPQLLLPLYIIVCTRAYDPILIDLSPYGQFFSSYPSLCLDFWDLAVYVLLISVWVFWFAIIVQKGKCARGFCWFTCYCFLYVYLDFFRDCDMRFVHSYFFLANMSCSRSLGMFMAFLFWCACLILNSYFILMCCYLLLIN